MQKGMALEFPDRQNGGMLEFCPISSKYIAPPGSTCLTPIWHPTLRLCCLKICDKSSTTTGLWWGAKKRTNLYRGSSIQRNVHIYKVLFSSIFMSSQIFREDFCCFFCRRASRSSWCDVFLVMKCKKYAALNRRYRNVTQSDIRFIH